MSFGIGLGAFVDGFSRGYGIRRQMDADRREDQNRAALTKIDTGAKAEFDKQVAAGTQSPDQFEQFWKSYALPMRRNELLRQGDVSGAKMLDDWGKSDAALEGGKLFSSAMFKAQTGDPGGALQDAIKAGQVKGYIDHGYELLGQEEINDPNGGLVGYRLKVKGNDGKALVQDIAVGDVPQLVATFANPDNAWQSHVKAREDQKKKGEELKEYEAKKQIDQKYEKPKVRDDAGDYEKVRADMAKNDLDWADRSPEDQDGIIRRQLEAGKRYEADEAAKKSATPQGAPGLGQPAPAPAPKAPAEQVVVDQNTGQIVPPQVARQNTPAPVGLGQSAPSPAPTPEAPKGPSKQQIIDDAADYIGKGGDPEYIAQRLMSFGIAEQEWPVKVRSAMAQRKPASPIVGLGQ